MRVPRRGYYRIYCTAVLIVDAVVVVVAVAVVAASAAAAAVSVDELEVAGL